MKKDQLPKNGVPYLDAFPFQHDILDSCHLNQEEQEFARRLTPQLIQGVLDETFQGHARFGDKLHHLHFESRNWERQAGQRCLAFGFPLLLSKQQSSVSLAPLFYWPVSLDPDPHRPNYWTLKSIPGRTPLLNPLLPLVNPSEESMPTPPWRPPVLPSSETIQSFGHQLAEWLATSWQDNWAEPFPIPPLEVLGELGEQPVILPCMVFGTFKPAFLPLEDSPWPGQETAGQEKEDRQPFERTLFSPVQATAWMLAHEKPGTLLAAKNEQQTREFLINLLHNALCNGERCLVLSDRMNRLTQLQSDLSGLGLDWLSFLLKDPGQDAYLLSELMKARANKEDAPPPFPRNDYNMALAKAKRQREKLDRAYKALQKPIFGPYSWTDLTGLFLRSSSIEGKELLSSQLATQDFIFNYEEYEELKLAINRSIPLYNQINTLKHPLTALHPSVILNYEKEPCLTRLQTLIKEFTERLEKLNHEVLRQADAYALKLNDHFEHGFLSLNARLQQVQELYSDYSHKFGEAFEKTSASTIRLKGLFDNRTRALKHAQEEVIQSYQALARHHQEHNYFEMAFLSTGESKNMTKVRESLDRFQALLSDWRQRIRDRVLEEVARLNQQTVYPELDFQERIAQLEENIHQAIQAFNEAEIYGETMEANMLTIPRKQKFLDSLLEKLETTRLNLRDFDPFYDWQRNWLQLTEPQQRLLRALIKVKPQHWISAFESWYFHHCLHRNFSDDLPTDDQALRVFNEAWTNLQVFLPKLIETEWLERQQQAFKNWKKQNKAGYQIWLGKGKREGSPQDWYSGNWDFLHDLFPIWMLSDSQAAALYKSDTCPEIDWAIVWEHQDIEGSLWQKLAPKVKRWIIIGSPGHSQKSWEIAQNNDWPAFTLGSLPPGEIPERLGLAEIAPKDPDHFQVVPISGLFDQSKKTNEAEAQEVLRLLNEVRPTPARTFPSVAILTLTVEQRDLIATYLLQIKQRNLQGSEKIRSLERNGLAVLHIDEFLGSSFDQYLFSTTFGPVNVQGALPNEIGYFTSPDGLKMMFAIEQAPFQSGIWLHSFTAGHLADNRLRSFARFMESRGREVFPASADKSPAPIPPFNQEIQAMLLGYFDEWRFEQVPPTDIYHYPVLLHHEKKPPFSTAVLSDLFQAHFPQTSYTWEWEVRKLLEARGVHVQNAWSVLCWRNPRQEARKIASRIITAYNRSRKEESQPAPLPEEEGKLEEQQPPSSDTE